MYQAVVEPYVAERFIPLVTNLVIGRTILMIIVGATLGGVVLEFVDDLLDDHIERKEAEEMAAEAAKKKQKKKR